MKNTIGFAALKTTALLLLFVFNPFAMWSQEPAVVMTAPSTTNWKIIKQGKHLTVRLNPDADLSLYRSVTVGEVAYTGSAKKLNSRDSAKVVSLLRTSLRKDLSAAELPQELTATEALTVNADITSVRRSHPVINVVASRLSLYPLISARPRLQHGW